MAERRRPRKRNAGPPRESKRLSLLDLPPAEPRDELPTNPGVVVRAVERKTLLPAAAEPLSDASLASLARAARRTSGFPTKPAASSRSLEIAARDAHLGISAKTDARREVAGKAAASPTEPSPPPDFGLPSSLPPPVLVPSEPPRERAPVGGNFWLRTLGVIALSASVGAVVSSLIWSAKSELGTAVRRETDAENARAPVAAPAPSCATTTVAEPAPPAATSQPSAAAARKLVPEAPRISFDALPLQAGRRRTLAVENVSLEPASSEGRARPASPPPALPVQPSRAAVSQAMSRAASAATSCDTSPQDGKVTVTFAPSGAVHSVSLVKGFGDAGVNSCVLRAFGRARVPAFSGDAVQVRKSVAW